MPATARVPGAGRLILQALGGAFLALLAALALVVVAYRRKLMWAYSEMSAARTTFLDPTSASCGISEARIDPCALRSTAYSARAARLLAQLNLRAYLRPFSRPTGWSLVASLRDGQEVHPVARLLRSRASASTWLLVVRGTLTTLEMSQDAEVSQVPLGRQFRRGPRQGASTHRGFHTLAVDLVAQLAPHAAAIRDAEVVVVTGHSLGASVSVLMAMWARAQVRPDAFVCCYTFACPRVGNVSMRKLLEATSLPVYRVVNQSDVIPNTPLSVMPDARGQDEPYVYVHVGSVVLFDLPRRSLQNNHDICTYIEAGERRMCEHAMRVQE